jgi:hypothetical protein
MTPAVYSPPSPSRARALQDGRAVSRRDQFRRTRTVVLEATNTCAKGRTAVVIVEALISCADVRAAFDEIDEKRHLVGIHLRFELEKGILRAIFDPAGTRSRRDVYPLRNAGGRVLAGAPRNSAPGRGI